MRALTLSFMLVAIGLGIACGCSSPWRAEFVTEKGDDGVERRILRVSHMRDNSYSGDYIPSSTVRRIETAKPVVVEPVKTPASKRTMREARLLRIWNATLYFALSGRFREARSGAQALTMIFGDLLRSGRRTLDDDRSDRVSAESNAGRSIDDVIAAGEAGFKELNAAPADNQSE